MFWRTGLLALLFGCNAQTKRPDVYLIAVETLRWDHVGAYNPSSPAQTPAIDALASDSVLFADAFSPISVTGPAFSSVMTGLSVRRHGVMMNLFRNGKTLDAKHPTIAEKMADHGYKTAAFVSAFTLRPKLGLDRGFSVYDTAGDKNRPGNVTARRFSDWLRVQEGPIFGWYHSFDPHGPVSRHLREGDVHSQLDRQNGLLDHIPHYQRIKNVTDPALYESLYARGVEFADAQVGKVLTALRETGRYDDAMIIFFADHGEGFRERDLWYDHGSFGHIEQTKVPLMVKLPNSKNGGTVDERLASIMDIAPTVLELAGAEIPKNLDGKSLLGEGVGHDYLIAESSHCKRIPILKCTPPGGTGKQVIARTKGMTLVSTMKRSGESIQQFDRASDPKEWNAIESKGPASVYEVLKAERADRTGRTYAPLPPLRQPRQSRQDVESEQLKALGYLE